MNLAARRDIFNNTNWLWQLKGYAISGIVLYHWFIYYLDGGLRIAFNLGGQGVHIFIILSAFSLCISYENVNIKWHIWYKKRLSKIVVPYYLSILVIVLSILISGMIARNIPRYLELSGLNLKTFLASVLFYRAFIDKYVMVINSPWWFIVTIIQLYLIFPLLYNGIKKHGLKALFITLLLTISYEVFYAVFLKSSSAVFSKFFLAFLFEYTAGIYLADIYIKNTDKFKKYTLGLKPFLFGLVMEAIGTGLAFCGNVGLAFNDIFNAAGYFLIVLNVCNWLCEFKIINRLFDWLGRYSMPIFLLHAPYIYLMFSNYKNSGLKNSLVFLPGYLVFVVIMSYLFKRVLIAIPRGRPTGGHPTFAARQQ